MKAILRFRDGGSGISQVQDSEDAQGNVFVLLEISRPNAHGHIVRFQFQGTIESRSQMIAEYAEIEPKALAPLLRLTS